MNKAAFQRSSTVQGLSASQSSSQNERHNVRLKPYSSAECSVRGLQRQITVSQNNSWVMLLSSARCVCRKDLWGTQGCGFDQNFKLPWVCMGFAPNHEWCSRLGSKGKPFCLKMDGSCLVHFKIHNYYQCRDPNTHDVALFCFFKIMINFCLDNFVCCFLRFKVWTSK